MPIDPNKIENLAMMHDLIFWIKACGLKDRFTLSYLLLHTVLNLTGSEDEDSDKLRDVMEPLWYLMSPDEKDVLEEYFRATDSIFKS